MDISYYEIDKDGKRGDRITYICFSELNNGLPHSIEFPCKVMGGLDEDQVKFYVELMANFLGQDRWTCMIESSTVTFFLDCNGLTYHKCLVYLTAFRNLCENPGYIAHAYKFKDSTLEEIFAEFQRAHYVCPCHNTGHSLLGVSEYMIQPASFLTIAEFQENLANPKIQTVNRHFKKP